MQYGFTHKKYKTGKCYEKSVSLAVVMTITAILAGCNKGEQQLDGS